MGRRHSMRTPPQREIGGGAGGVVAGGGDPARLAEGASEFVPVVVVLLRELDVPTLGAVELAATPPPMRSASHSRVGLKVFVVSSKQSRRRCELAGSKRFGLTTAEVAGAGEAAVVALPGAVVPVCAQAEAARRAARMPSLDGDVMGTPVILVRLDMCRAVQA